MHETMWEGSSQGAQIERVNDKRITYLVEHTEGTDKSLEQATEKVWLGNAAGRVDLDRERGRLGGRDVRRERVERRGEHGKQSRGWT